MTTGIRCVLTAVLLLAAAAAAGAAQPTPPQQRSEELSGGTSPSKPLLECGPIVAAVRGGDGSTACLPNDPGEHGKATVRRGVTGSSKSDKEADKKRKAD